MFLPIRSPVFVSQVVTYEVFLFSGEFIGKRRIRLKRINVIYCYSVLAAFCLLMKTLRDPGHFQKTLVNPVVN